MASECAPRIPSEAGNDTTLGQSVLPLPTESIDNILVGGARPGKEKKGPEEVNGSSESSEKEPTMKPKRSSKGVEPFEKWERDAMEKLLGQLCGHLGLSLGRV